MMTSSKRVKFLDPAEVDEALAELAEIACECSCDVAIIGGVAMMVYGSDRLTKDVDVAAADDHPFRARLSVSRRLSFGGIAALTRRKHPVDVVVREDEYRNLYNKAVESAVDQGLPLRVVTPEYLAALKMAAARDKDVSDLKTLIRLEVLDLVAARQIIRTYLGEYAARELDSLAAEVEWDKSREIEGN